MSESKRNRELQAAREATPSSRYPGRALTRAELAELVAQHVWEHHGIEAPIDRKYLGRLERGEVRWPNTRYRQALREILGAPSDRALGFSSANAERTAKELEPVDRRSFFRAAAAGGVAIAGRERMWGWADPLEAVSSGELDAVTAVVERLERNDAAFGGGAPLQVAVDLYEQVTAWRNEGTHSLRTDRALARLQGDAGAWAGWLAYDAGDLPTARSYLSDTVVHARTSDLPDIEVRAMSYLVLLLNRTSRHRDALHCAEAGQRIASPNSPREVRALLHMRAAASHAGLGDRAAYQQAVAAAYRAFEGPSGTPAPLWARFVTESELQGLCGDCLTVLGDHDAAAQAFRSIADHPDPRYRRNTTYYSAKLAASLLEQGDITEASERALAVVPDASSLHSRRVVSIMDGVQSGVVRHQGSVPAAREFVHAYREARLRGPGHRV